MKYLRHPISHRRPRISQLSSFPHQHFPHPTHNFNKSPTSPHQPLPFERNLQRPAPSNSRAKAGPAGSYVVHQVVLDVGRFDRNLHDLKAVEGQGKAVEGRGMAVEGRGKAVEGQGKVVECRGKAVECRGKAVEGFEK